MVQKMGGKNIVTELQSKLAPSAHGGRGNKGSLRGATIEDLPEINAVVAAAVQTWALPKRVLRLALTSLLYRESDFPHVAAVVAEDRTEAAAATKLGDGGQHRHAGRTLCAPNTRDLRRSEAFFTALGFAPFGDSGNDALYPRPMWRPLC
jgi:hypothetical protein